MSIAVHGLSHSYGVSEVLRLPSWQFAPGERWLVHGPSGCDKTTLLHIVAGLVRPGAGSVKVAGEDLLMLRGSALDRWRGATVGIVLQAMHLVSHLNVLDNMRLAQYAARLPQNDAKAGEALGVSDKAARRPGELSQGEPQRIPIARAVMNAPKLLLRSGARAPHRNHDRSRARQSRTARLQRSRNRQILWKEQ